MTRPQRAHAREGQTSPSLPDGETNHADTSLDALLNSTDIRPAQSFLTHEGELLGNPEQEALLAPILRDLQAKYSRLQDNPHPQLSEQLGTFVGALDRFNAKQQEVLRWHQIKKTLQHLSLLVSALTFPGTTAVAIEILDLEVSKIAEMVSFVIFLLSLTVLMLSSLSLGMLTAIEDELQDSVSDVQAAIEKLGFNSHHVIQLDAEALTHLRSAIHTQLPSLSKQGLKTHVAQEKKAHLQAEEEERLKRLEKARERLKNR